MGSGTSSWKLGVTGSVSSAITKKECTFKTLIEIQQLTFGFCVVLYSSTCILLLSYFTMERNYHRPFSENS